MALAARPPVFSNCHYWAADRKNPLPNKGNSMTRVEIEMFSETTNCPVVRVPHRNFPGVVIQGDSLMILLCEAQDVCKLAAGSDNPELIEGADYLRDLLSDYVSEYERVMDSNGLKLPYSRRKTS